MSKEPLELPLQPDLEAGIKRLLETMQKEKNWPSDGSPVLIFRELIRGGFSLTALELAFRTRNTWNKLMESRYLVEEKAGEESILKNLERNGLSSIYVAKVFNSSRNNLEFLYHDLPNLRAAESAYSLPFEAITEGLLKHGGASEAIKHLFNILTIAGMGEFVKKFPDVQKRFYAYVGVVPKINFYKWIYEILCKPDLQKRLEIPDSDKLFCALWDTFLNISDLPSKTDAVDSIVKHGRKDEPAAAAAASVNAASIASNTPSMGFFEGSSKRLRMDIEDVEHILKELNTRLLYLATANKKDKLISNLITKVNNTLEKNQSLAELKNDMDKYLKTLEKGLFNKELYAPVYIAYRQIYFDGLPEGVTIRV